MASNPYNRPRSDYPPAVTIDRDGEYWDIERLLNKRVTRRGRGGKGTATEFLIRWKGYGPEWDAWVNTKNMDAPALIEDYERHAGRMPTDATNPPLPAAEPSTPPPPSTPPAPPRRRGRPRKNPSDIPPASPPPRRRPGRPRKAAPEV